MLDAKPKSLIRFFNYNTRKSELFNGRWSADFAINETLMNKKGNNSKIHSESICNALRNLVPFMQFEKHEKDL